MLVKVAKAHLNKFFGFLVSGGTAAVFLPVKKAKIGSIVLTCIGFRCGKLVAYALDYILIRHQRLNLAFVVLPVFKVMLVVSLVVKPGKASSGFTAANAYGRAISLVIFSAFKKLNR